MIIDDLYSWQGDSTIFDWLTPCSMNISIVGCFISLNCKSNAVDALPINAPHRCEYRGIGTQRIVGRNYRISAFIAFVPRVD